MYGRQQLYYTCSALDVVHYGSHSPPCTPHPTPHSRTHTEAAARRAAEANDAQEGYLQGMDLPPSESEDDSDQEDGSDTEDNDDSQEQTFASSGHDNDAADSESPEEEEKTLACNMQTKLHVGRQ